MTKEIQLTKGKVAIVDDEDYEEVSQWKWSYSVEGYARRGYRIKDGSGRQKHVALHRQIMKPPAGMDVDHINHDPLDNRRCNMRICTRSQNLANRPKHRGSTSEYKGVCKVKSKWRASVRHNGITILLGLYNTEIEAARAYDRGAVELFGEFAYTNF